MGVETAEKPRVFQSLPCTKGGEPLIVGGNWRETTVTVALSTKWEALYVMHRTNTPGLRVERVPFPDMSQDEAAYGLPDEAGVPNPIHVILWARSQGYFVDPLALDAMIGRWVREVGAGDYLDALGDVLVADDDDEDAAGRDDGDEDE